MAKPKKSASTINKQLLTKIVEATEGNNHVMITQEEGVPLLNHVPALIIVNTDIVEGDKAAARATAEGIAMIKGEKPAAMTAEASGFEILKGVELPASRRGQGLRGGRTNKYPFDKMGVGDSFFVPASEEMPNPLKTLGSTVSSANMRYAIETGETKEAVRTKRGADRKAMIGADGKKVKETVTLPVYKFERKFEIRGVKSGVKYGNWTATADGVLIARSA